MQKKTKTVTLRLTEFYSTHIWAQSAAVCWIMVWKCEMCNKDEKHQTQKEIKSYLRVTDMTAVADVE